MAFVLAATALARAGTADAANEPPADPARAFLESDDPLTLERARRILLARRGDAFEVFARALSHEDARRREAAVVSLGELEDDAAGDLLRGALDDEDPSVRVAALKALALQPDGRADDRIFAAAGERWWALRRGAALALARVPGETAARALGRLARDADPDVAEAGLRALLRAEHESAAQALVEVLRAIAPEDLAAPVEAPSAAPRAESFVAPLTPSERAAAIVRRLRTFEDEGSRVALEEVLAGEGAPDALRLEAARSLAWRGVHVSSNEAIAALVLDGAMSGDPDLRQPAVFVLARERDAARDLLLRRLAAGASGGTDAGDADVRGLDALALLLVTLDGAAAREPLLTLARDASVDAAGRAAAVRGLRRFRSVDTTFELLWIYDPGHPRVLRDELCAAFEDLPRSEEARSGLISALADPDSNLRLRAFRLLIAVGASTEQEEALLWSRIEAEPVEWVQRRMSRLMATHASGEAARAFAYRVLGRLTEAEPIAAAARATLENLGDESLRAEIGREVAKRLGSGPLDDERYRLLTRLGGPEADEAAARELRRRFEAGAPEPIVQGLVALRAGGGARALGVAQRGLSSDDRDVRLETFRASFKRGVTTAFAAFLDAYDDLASETRVELVGMVRFATPDEAATGLEAVLSRESDPVVRAAVVQRAGELEAPMVDTLVALVDGEDGAALRVPVAESLAAIGGERAAAVLREWFRAAAARAALAAGNDEAAPAEAGANGEDDALDRVWLESMARAVARTGDLDVAVPLAELVFLRAADREADVYDTDAAFAFEVTIVQALLDLARSSGQPLHVAAALEVEVERTKQSGRIALLPKALFVGLEETLAGAPPAFDAVRAQFLDLAYRLPPRTGRRELPAAARLAELATREHDHARAARYLERSVLLIELLGVKGGRWLTETLGEAAPHAGFDPRTNLEARVWLSRARASAVLGEDATALDAFGRAVEVAPFDAWLRFGVAADVAAYELGNDLAKTLAREARALAEADARLALHVGRLLADLGDTEASRAALAAFETHRDAGLEADAADDRIALAESWVRLGDPAHALQDLERARSLDPVRTASRLADSPRLRALLPR